MEENEPHAVWKKTGEVGGSDTLEMDLSVFETSLTNIVISKRVIFINHAAGSISIRLPPEMILTKERSILDGASLIDPNIVSGMFLRAVEAVKNKSDDQSLEDAMEEQLHSEITAAMLEVRQRK